MVIGSSAALKRLQQLQSRIDDVSIHQKLDLLQVLETGSLRHSRDVCALHDVLCVMRAYPDNAAVLSRVDRLLNAFAGRKDVLRQHRALADTGIAGTPIHFRFYWQTAEWLFERWPDALTIDWPLWEHRDQLEELWQSGNAPWKVW